jgi:hypothetical protein
MALWRWAMRLPGIFSRWLQEAVPLFGKFPLRTFDDFGQINIHGLRDA